MKKEELEKLKQEFLYGAGAGAVAAAVAVVAAWERLDEYYKEEKADD